MAETTIDVDEFDFDDDTVSAVIEAERAFEGEPVSERDACLPTPEGVDAAPVEALAATAGMISVNQLDGVPLFFARIGTPAQHSFAFDPTFHDECIATIRSVRHRVPASYGKLTRITTAGTFVDKPGQHKLGRAIDHDAWRFQHVTISPFAHEHKSGDVAKRRRYWALAAIMRSHSAFVLHGEYNAAHADHIHHDKGGSFAFSTSSEATVKLVQAICKHIFGKTALEIDGDYGPKSKAAVSAAMAKLDLSGDITDASQFKRFLLRSGRLGFVLAPPA